MRNKTVLDNLLVIINTLCNTLILSLTLFLAENAIQNKITKIIAALFRNVSLKI